MTTGKLESLLGDAEVGSGRKWLSVVSTKLITSVLDDVLKKTKPNHQSSGVNLVAL